MSCARRMRVRRTDGPTSSQQEMVGRRRVNKQQEQKCKWTYWPHGSPVTLFTPLHHQLASVRKDVSEHIKIPLGNTCRKGTLKVGDFL